VAELSYYNIGIVYIYVFLVLFFLSWL